MKYDIILHVTDRELQEIGKHNKAIESQGNYDKEQKSCLFFVFLMEHLNLTSEDTQTILSKSSDLKIQSDFNEIKRRLSYFH